MEKVEYYERIVYDVECPYCKHWHEEGDTVPEEYECEKCGKTFETVGDK